MPYADWLDVGTHSLAPIALLRNPEFLLNFPTFLSFIFTFTYLAASFVPTYPLAFFDSRLFHTRYCSPSTSSSLFTGFGLWGILESWDLGILCWILARHLTQTGKLRVGKKKHLCPPSTSSVSMSETQASVQKSPAVVDPAAAEPVTATAPEASTDPIRPMATDSLTPASRSEVTPTGNATETPVVDPKGENLAKNEEVVEAQPINEGILAYKAPGLVKYAMLSQHMFNAHLMLMFTLGALSFPRSFSGSATSHSSLSIYQDTSERKRPTWLITTWHTPARLERGSCSSLSVSKTRIIQQGF
jgi:hypothetical protein